MSARKNRQHQHMDFKEAEVQYLVDNGFNFTRLLLGFSTLRYPDFQEDMMLVNENELLDLDRLIV